MECRRLRTSHTGLHGSPPVNTAGIIFVNTLSSPFIVSTERTLENSNLKGTARISTIRGLARRIAAPVDAYHDKCSVFVSRTYFRLTRPLARRSHLSLFDILLVLVVLCTRAFWLRVLVRYVEFMKQPSAMRRAHHVEGDAEEIGVTLVAAFLKTTCKLSRFHLFQNLLKTNRLDTWSFSCVRETYSHVNMVQRPRLR